ncbi:MAG: hypothetical protein QM651_15905 [Rhodoblastus sp.]
MDDTNDFVSRGALVAPASQSAGATAAAFQPEIQDSGRNAVFAALVKGDSDITGLVAYSIFKQNELDWLQDFRNAKGREPSEAEAEAYIIGESTPRRLATYRHLADATLSGNGPDVAAGGPSTPRATYQPAAGGGLGMSAIVYVVLALVLLVAVYFAARYGVPKAGG